MALVDLEGKSLSELRDVGVDLDLGRYGSLKRQELVARLLQAYTDVPGNLFTAGILDIVEDGFGFLRRERLLRGPEDVHVPQAQIRRYGLRKGDMVSGQVQPPKPGEKFYGLLRLEAVNGRVPETARRRPRFDDLVPIFPKEQYKLETTRTDLSTRLVDLVAPIGRGQRATIVSPPKAGKTMLLQAIARGILTNYSDVHLMACLIGERPEEVTDWRRTIQAEIFSSTFDEPTENHTRVAAMALERAKRLVEGGRHVAVLLDSITRLTRAYNLDVPPSGRTLSGGVDPAALVPAKRFFGAARNIEGDGSLTIIATCLVDTQSRMDDVIYEEFKGTGNMELFLDRRLAERRIFPAIDIQRSSTRREELLFDEQTLRQVWLMRRMLAAIGAEATELMLQRLVKTQSNKEFLETLSKELP